MNGSPIKGLTAEQFDKNVQQLVDLAMSALGHHRIVNDEYAETIIALTTVPRLRTRLKMALLPGRWPHVREGNYVAALSRLHADLALLVSRAEMLRMMQHNEDSQTAGGNATEGRRSFGAGAP